MHVSMNIYAPIPELVGLASICCRSQRLEDNIQEHLTCLPQTRNEFPVTLTFSSGTVSRNPNRKLVASKPSHLGPTSDI